MILYDEKCFFSSTKSGKLAFWLDPKGAGVHLGFQFSYVHSFVRSYIHTFVSLDQNELIHIH